MASLRSARSVLPPCSPACMADASRCGSPTLLPPEMTFVPMTTTSPSVINVPSARAESADGCCVCSRMPSSGSFIMRVDVASPGGMSAPCDVHAQCTLVADTEWWLMLLKARPMARGSGLPLFWSCTCSRGRLSLAFSPELTASTGRLPRPAFLCARSAATTAVSPVTLYESARLPVSSPSSSSTVTPVNQST